MKIFSLSAALLGCALVFSTTQIRAATVDFEDHTGPSTFDVAGPAQTLVYTFGGLQATFTGGVILTGETQQTTDDSSVYATSEPSVAGGDISLSNPLTVTFNQAIQNFQVDILNAFSGNYRLSDNDGHTFDFSLSTTGGSVQTVGFAAAGTQVQIEYLDGPWDFAIDNVKFNEPLTSDTPEPASLLSMGGGLLLLGFSTLRRRLCG